MPNFLLIIIPMYLCEAINTDRISQKQALYELLNQAFI